MYKYQLTRHSFITQKSRRTYKNVIYYIYANIDMQALINLL